MLEFTTVLNIAKIKAKCERDFINEIDQRLLKLIPLKSTVTQTPTF